MKTATIAEFRYALARAGHPSPRFLDGGRRSMSKIYSDCGTEVAEEHIFYTRGKETSRDYAVNPTYLEGFEKTS